MHHLLKKLFFIPFVLLVLCSFSTIAQDLPPIQNYGPIEYSGEYQNWAISQSNSKKIYVANHTSLLEYDGVRWKKYKLPLETIIRSIKTVGERIYMGGYEEFGFWNRNKKGILEYTSLSDKFKDEILDNEEFWDILVFDTSILFQSLDRIYIYDLETENLSVIEAKTEKAKLFAIGSSNSIKTFVDDELVYELPNSADKPYDHPHYLLLNIALGGNLGGEVPENFSEATFEIDYVKIYQ